MEQIKVIIVGNGERANCYCKYALSNPDKLKVILPQSIGLEHLKVVDL